MDEDDAFGELTYGDDFEDYGNGGENFEEADDAENIETKEFSEVDNNDFNDNDIYDNGGGGPSKTKPKIRKEDKERKRKLKTIKKPPGIMTLEAKRRPNAFMEMSNSLKPGESVFNSDSPLDWHLRIGEEELAAKRRRIEVENVVGQITLQILAARMAQKQRKSGGDSTFGTQFPLKNVAEKEECKLLELPPMDGYGWYGISSTDGNVRRYVPMRKKMRVMQSTRDALEGKTKDNAEMESYYEMVAQIEEQKQRRILEEMEATSTHLMECDESYGEKGLIWTQKYAPKNFLDLLTNDETNRLVLLWLRLWEAHVFRKKGPNFWESLNEKERTLMEVEHRKGGQILPKQKILVLYGSSGVGKSSLAQIAAKQAGYRPLILPMSEFHNVTELRNRLENAINTTAIQTHFQQMNMADEGDGDEKPKTSMTMISEKPVCFVVEGLELATADMVQFLCNWARRSGNEAIIRRPIICTCASIWQNSALKELRTGSMALRVQHCNRERLRKRLLEICRLEGIEMDRAELDELIHSHAQDIRLCLNTLQFMTANANQRHQTKTADSQLQPNEAMNTAMSVSILDVLAAIFTLDFHEDNRGIVRPPVQRVRSLLNLIGQLPQEDFTRLQQLIFTNFASILKLSNDQCFQIAKLLVEIDRLQNFIQQGQHFVLGNYLVYRILGVHFICAVHVSRRLQFNMAAQPFNERLRESQQIIRSLKTNAANGQCFLANGDLVWLLPHFHSVLQPYIQSANAHLHMHRSQEQRQLRRVVQLMHAYRLQYVLKFGSEAGGGKSIEAHYRFEPPFDQLTRFPLAPNPNLNGRHFALAESLKKFIAQQVELASTKASKKKKDDEELFDDEEHLDDYY